MYFLPMFSLIPLNRGRLSAASSPPPGQFRGGPAGRALKGTQTVCSQPNWSLQTGFSKTVRPQTPRIRVPIPEASTSPRRIRPASSLDVRVPTTNLR